VTFALLLIRRPSRWSLFPYTTLFRSCPEDRVERPRPYDIVALGAELCREERGSAVPSVPPGDVEHRYRRVHPGVEHIFFAGELRSEEHTSELQSRENLVCRLLLEKKK